MSDAHHLDPAMARSDFQRCVIEYRNQGLSWPKTAQALNVPVSWVRRSWADANRVQRGGVESTPKSSRPDSFLGHEDLLRGLPMTGFGGAIRGTNPGQRGERKAS